MEHNIIEELAKRQVVVRLLFPGEAEGFFPIQFELLTATSRDGVKRFDQDKFDYWHVCGQVVKTKQGYADVRIHQSPSWMSGSGYRTPFSTTWSRAPMKNWAIPVDFLATIQNQDDENSSGIGRYHPQVRAILTMIYASLFRGSRDGGISESTVVESMVKRLWALIERLNAVHPDDGVVRLY